MEKHSFITILFMYIVGIIFILIAIAPFIYISSILIKNIYIKNFGVETDAIVDSIKVNEHVSERRIDNDYTSRSLYRDNYTITQKYKQLRCKIVYNVNGVDYSYSFRPNTYINEKAEVKIFYLSDNPKEIYVSIENQQILLKLIYGLLISIPSYFLGYICVKKFNIFKYKRIIKVV